MRAVAYPAKAALAIYANSVGEVRELFPKAVVLNEAVGQAILAISHSPENVRKLIAAGVQDVPSPMYTLYSFPGRFKPFDAQRVTAEFASMNDRCFILNSMGLGKTMTSLWAFDFLRSRGWKHKCLVVCPLSTMERTWADEVFQSFPHLKAVVLYGSADKRKKLLEQRDADVYIINTDGAAIIKEALGHRPDIDHVIIDEVALFRNHSTARWKVLNEICNKQCNRSVWGLTGSPTPNVPCDAWAQCKLVTPQNPNLPKFFSRFREMTMYRKGLYEWAPKKDSVDTVYNTMQPSVRFSLDDCLDLPPQTIINRDVQLSNEQKKAYKDMFVKLAFELDGQEVNAMNEAIKASKLLQICCGVAYDNAGQEVLLPMGNRMDTLEEIVNESEGKVICFVPFKGALNTVVEGLRSKGITADVIDGSVSKPQRDKVFYEFQNGDTIRVLVANPQAMSHGLTLTAATTIVWFGPTYSNEVYQQACARVRRPGQKRTTVIVHLVSSDLESTIYNRLHNKQSLQGALLDLIAKDSNSLLS